MRLIKPIIFATITGCTWVSKSDLDARMPEFDNDGDGVAAKDDCDDNDPDRYPGNVEIWYDGKDANCDDLDDYDADQDGFVRVGDHGKKTLDVPGSGQSDGGDCDDTPEPDGDPCSVEDGLVDADGRTRGCLVNPDAADDWYDGIDSNCDGKDDYDQDQDGSASKEYSEEYGPTQYVEESGLLNNEDCDDEDNEVYPGAFDEELDGYDKDCAGNDDFDIDGDGYYSDAASFYQPTVYAEDTTGTALPGDCDDTDASMNPGITDTPYDGIDNDCLNNDDFDQDQDGYVQDIHIGQLTYPVVGSGDLPGGDCNDDPGSGGDDANPSVIEILSDEVDHDCDSVTGAAGENTFFMNPLADVVGFGGETLTEFIGVHTITFTENVSGIHLIIGAEANTMNTNGVVHNFDFDSSDVLGGVIGERSLLEGSDTPASPYTLSPAVSIWANDEVLLGTTGATLPSTELRTLYLRGRDEVTGEDISLGDGPYLDEVGLSEWNPMTSVSMLRDSAGHFHTVGCDPITEVVQYTIATPESLHLGEDDPPTATFDEEVHIIDHSASMCALVERGGEILLLNDHEGTFRAHTIDISSSDLVLLEEHESPIPGLHSDWTDSEVHDMSFDQLFVPRQRLPEEIVLLTQGDRILIVDESFALLQEVDVESDIAQMDAVFDPYGILHIIAIDNVGVGRLYQVDLDDGVSDALRLGTTGLRRAAIWLDETTGNTLQIVAATEPDGTVDPLVYGVAYLTSPVR